MLRLIETAEKDRVVYSGNAVDAARNAHNRLLDILGHRRYKRFKDAGLGYCCPLDDEALYRFKQLRFRGLDAYTKVLLDEFNTALTDLVWWEDQGVKTRLDVIEGGVKETPGVRMIRRNIKKREL